MDFREKMLTRWGRFSAEHPIRVTVIILIFILAAIPLAEQLTVTTRWSDLLPLHDPLVKEFNKIIEDYTSSSNSILVVMGPEERIKAFVDDVVPRIESLRDYVKRVDYKIDEDFIERHGFMLTKSRDLKNSTDIFQDLNLIPLITHINDNLERTYIGDEESLSDREKEDNAIRSLDGLEYWIETMQAYVDSGRTLPGQRAEKAVGRFLVGDPYFISPDKRTLAIFIEPTFDITDVDAAVASTDSIQAIVDARLDDYPDVYAGLAGTIPLSRDEMFYAMKDMQTTSILALALVIILFIVVFRTVSSPFIAGLNLLLSILFAAGVIALFLHSLNIMTSRFAVILIGLGIDFSIHVISLYSERRGSGEPQPEAMSKALSRSGEGIITGGVTTAVAFLTLMISDTRGIKEMGLVLGLGIMAVMIITLALLPSLLILREKISNCLAGLLKHEISRNRIPKSVEFNFLGKFGELISRRPVVSLLIVLVLTALLLVSAFNVKFDYNYLNMEPKGLVTVAMEDSLLAAFKLSSDFAMITTSTVDEAREIAEKVKRVPSVGMVESISEFIPSKDEQARRSEYILKIRDYLENPQRPITLSSGNIEELIQQLDRLDMNIYELGQMAFLGGRDRVDKKCSLIIGGPDEDSSRNIITGLVRNIESNPEKAVAGLDRFQDGYRSLLRESALRMADSSRITLQSLPSSITDRFLNKGRDRFLVTITPAKQVWNIEFMRLFTEQMQRIDERITGTPPLFLRLIDLIGEDGEKAAGLAIIVVFLLLWLDFRKLRIAFMAMIPLLSGAVWMIGLMSLFDLPLTIVNVMAIPMIIGIGIDDGVHLLHRYRVEGWQNSRIVLQSTGRAILLTSLTTMAGFGSLMIAQYRGFNSLGALLAIGVAACFATTVLFLPPLAGLFRRRT
jgi:predicted RND superfamily exporter protein